MAPRISRIEDVPHDPVYVEAFGEEYRTHPDFIAKMQEAIQGTRDIGNVRADIRESVAFEKRSRGVADRGW